MVIFVMIYLHRIGKKNTFKNKSKFGDAHPPLMTEIRKSFLFIGPKDPITNKSRDTKKERHVPLGCPGI